MELSIYLKHTHTQTHTATWGQASAEDWEEGEGGCGGAGGSRGGVPREKESTRKREHVRLGLDGGSPHLGDGGSPALSRCPTSSPFPALIEEGRGRGGGPGRFP